VELKGGHLLFQFCALKIQQGPLVIEVSSLLLKRGCIAYRGFECSLCCNIPLY
jgi:hypothetical protein